VVTAFEAGQANRGIEDADQQRSQEAMCERLVSW
jgi:hypothetical protein